MNRLTDRERFLKAVRWQELDRPPLWADGVQEETWVAWSVTHPNARKELEEQFLWDRCQVIPMHLGPMVPCPLTGREDDWDRRAEAFQIEKAPHELVPKIAASQDLSVPAGVWVSRGFFLTLGVEDWTTLCQVLFAVYDQPRQVQKVIEKAVNLVLYQLDRLPTDVVVDFAVISEPIASFHQPVLSPVLYRRFCGEPYRLLVDRLKARGVALVLVETYGYVEPLIPIWLEMGIGGLWCHHANAAGMDYRILRKKYGRELVLFGGIDARCLLKGRIDMEQAVRRALSLIESGGYLPFLDDKVRPNIPFDAYRHYRATLDEMVRRLCSAAPALN
ncbi:MAG: hypothetical protein NZ959_05820 [Armatimonadetes bacterium]|nr:hypothetical protein [Armatimonadota bacterium]MDW8122169.1 uroporphyrinogen decarboxylase family protein [Armatimonadota bacterium]